MRLALQLMFFWFVAVAMGVSYGALEIYGRQAPHGEGKSVMAQADPYLPAERRHTN